MFKNKQLWLIYAIVLVDLIVANGLGPLVAKYVEELPAKAVFITGGTAIALAAQLAISPPMGDYSDKRGRKPVALLTAFVSLGASLLLLPVKAWTYIANRVTEGTTNGMYAVMRSAVTDISEKEEVQRTSGILSFILPAGAILGPMITAGLIITMPDARDDPKPVVFFMIGMAVLNVILVFLFKETKEEKQDISKGELKEKAVNALKIGVLWKQLDELNEQLPGIKPLFVLNIVGGLATGYYNYFVAFLTQSKLKLEPLQTSYFFVFYGLLTILANFIFFKYILGRVNKRIAILVLAGLGVATQIAFAFSEESETMLYIVAGVDALTVTLLGGIIGGVLTKMVNESEGQGETFGNVQGLSAVASFATAVVNSGLAGISSKAPFFWFAACMAAVLILCLRLPAESRKVTDEKGN